VTGPIDPRWRPDPPPPQQLDYRAPRRGGLSPDAITVLKLMAGFGAGIAASILVWYAGIFPKSTNAFTAAYGVLGLKVVVAVVLMFVPNWRSFAAGLLLSIGVGTLIFFVSCGGGYVG
jgi:hypothetical protein